MTCTNIKIHLLLHTVSMCYNAAALEVRRKQTALHELLPKEAAAMQSHASQPHAGSSHKHRTPHAEFMPSSSPWSPLPSVPHRL